MYSSKFKTILSLATLAATLISGCSKDEIDTYRIEDSSVYFPTNNTEYSFIDTPDAEYAEATVRVTVVGPTASFDRTIGVEVDAENTAADATKYEILSSTVKAGATSGTITVRIYNDPVLEDDEFTLGLKLTESKDFKPDTSSNTTYGTERYNATVLTWNNQISRPEWLLKGGFLKYVSYTALYVDADGNVYGEQDADNTRTRISASYRTNGLYSKALMKILRELWPEKVNVNGMYGTDADTLELYPLVIVNLGGYAYVLIHALETYVDEYNAAHPGAPLRHSDDAVVLNTAGSVVTVSSGGKKYTLKLSGNPPILVNSYSF